MATNPVAKFKQAEAEYQTTSLIWLQTNVISRKLYKNSKGTKLLLSGCMTRFISKQMELDTAKLLELREWQKETMRKWTTKIQWTSKTKTLISTSKTSKRQWWLLWVERLIVAKILWCRTRIRWWQTQTLTSAIKTRQVECQCRWGYKPTQTYKAKPSSSQCYLDNKIKLRKILGLMIQPIGDLVGLTGSEVSSTLFLKEKTVMEPP